MNPLRDEMVNESVANMYHSVYLMQKSGKLSATNAKKLIKDLLLKIWSDKITVDKSGKIHDLTSVNVDEALKKLNEEISKT